MIKRLLAKLFGPAILIGCLGVVVLMLFTGDEAGSSQVEESDNVVKVAASPSPGPSPIVATKAEKRMLASDASCLAEPSAIEDMRKQREDIEQKKKQIAEKETELKARERAIDEELKKLALVREEIAKSETLHKKDIEERVNKLVETFETMSPKVAAQMLASVDQTLAIAALSKMSTPKLAKIMNVMEPGRSSHLVELLAGIVKARTENTIAKGGEKNNGNTEQQRASLNPGLSSPVERAPGSKAAE